MNYLYLFTTQDGNVIASTVTSVPVTAIENIFNRLFKDAHKLNGLRYLYCLASTDLDFLNGICGKIKDHYSSVHKEEMVRVIRSLGKTYYVHWEYETGNLQISPGAIISTLPELRTTLKPTRISWENVSVRD